MSAPQVADANTSSEWFRTVAEPGAETPQRASNAALPTDGRRKRFVRLVTCTMGGLVAFTLLGVASFAGRQNAMQSALAAPVPPPVVAATPGPQAPVAEAPAIAAAAAAAAVGLAATPAAPVAAPKPAAAKATAKPSKKAVKRTTFLSSATQPAKLTGTTPKR